MSITELLAAVGIVLVVALLAVDYLVGAVIDRQIQRPKRVTNGE